jgi:SnoaL-like domain
VQVGISSQAPVMALRWLGESDRELGSMEQQRWLNELFKKIDGKDTAGFLSFLTSDARFRFGNSPLLQGKQAIGETVDAFFASIRASQHHLVNTWSIDDAVICQGEVCYTRRDNSTLTLPFVNIFRMQGRHIDQYLIYVDVTPLYSSAVA